MTERRAATPAARAVARLGRGVPRPSREPGAARRRRRRLDPGRDPGHDSRPGPGPMAGYVGPLLIGLAVGMLAIPVCWLLVFARHRRIAYRATGSGPRGAAAGSACFVAVRRDSAAGRRVPARDRPVPRRDLRRRRDHPLGRALGAPMTATAGRRPSRRAVRRPQGAGRGGDRGRPDEILELSHRDPRQPRARVRGAPGVGLGRRGDRAPRVRGRASGRQPRDRRARPPRRPRPVAADRDPRRVRRAPRPWPRLRAQHDGRVGVGAAIGSAAVRDSIAGEIVFLGTPAEERGAARRS